MMGSPRFSASSSTSSRPRLFHSLSLCLHFEPSPWRLLMTCEMACRMLNNRIESGESSTCGEKLFLPLSLERRSLSSTSFFGSIVHHYLSPPARLCCFRRTVTASNCVPKQIELLSHSINEKTFSLLFSPSRLTVLGNHLRRAWHRRYWCIPWRFRSSIGAHQRLLQ